MRERGLQIALMCLGVAVAAYAGCGGDSTTGGTATSGDTTTSGSSTSGTTTSSAATTSSGSTSTGGAKDNLGITCAADGDCGAGLKCLTPEGTTPALGGGPANGYCSKDCATDEDCPGNNSLCAIAGPGQMGVCLLTCDLGPDLASLDEMLDPSKCLGREDLRCTTVANATACVPTCGKDDQCPAGRACDPRGAVCVDKANTGFPLGAKCDSKAMTPDCAGICVGFTDVDASWCSSPCVLGGDFTDLTTIADCGGVDKGMCYYRASKHGAGDSGFCVSACKSHDQCQNPSFWCSFVGLPDSGYCTVGTPCPGGQTDCKNAGDKCTDTKYGPICLDPQYPLGNAAPGGTSSSSGSSGSGAGGATTSSSVGSGSSGVGGAASTATTGVGAVTASASSSSTGP